jgi:phospholipase B1
MLIFLLSLIFSTCIAVLDIGAPGYSCPANLMMRSPTRPTSAHAVRPADIDIVMAMGDSLTAGYCTDDVGGCHAEYRGLSFGGGEWRGLDTHITLANIIQKYNPKAVGGGLNGTGGWNDFPVAQLNCAISGMRANNLPYQAQNIINTLKAHPDLFDMQNDWKLLNIFIGYNDLCNCGGNDCYCYNKTAFDAQNYANWIRTALNLIRSNVPRVIVNLVQMTHLEHFAGCGTGACGICNNVTVADLTTLINQYQAAEKALETDGEFDTTDDFTLVVQPWFTNNTKPYYPNGTINREFWAVDCYHYSSYGHALLSSWWWKNMLEPVGMKTPNANLSVPALPLACPDAECPYIRTTKNSVNCQQFNGTCISDGGSCTTGSSCCSGLCFNKQCS